MRHLFILLFSIWSTVSYSQTNLVTGNPLDAYWNLPTIPTQAQATLKLGTSAVPSPSSNEVIANQAGVLNTATLSVLSGVQNRLEVNQTSSFNSANASLSGVNNSVLLNQTGGGNTVGFDLNGTNNRFLFTQDGGDTIQMHGLQQSNTQLELTQGSGNNSITLDNTSLFKDAFGTGIPNLRIEQSGGATVTIQQGKIIGN